MALAEILRVAKLAGDIVAVYAMQRRGNTFHLFGVVVAPSVRKQGLGRWVTGHAIGVAESKGGRHLTLDNGGSSRCFSRMGFKRMPEDSGRDSAGNKLRVAGILQFDMIQE